jgi:hypothetical protein
MVTPSEFERVQKIIGRPGRPAPQKHEFAYTGLMRCGSCGCAVTAEVHTKRNGTRYEYYRCTKKRRDFRCPEGYVESNALESQFIEFLEAYTLPGDVQRWAIQKCKERAALYEKDDVKFSDALREKLGNIQRELSTATDLRIKGVLDDADFLPRRESLRSEITRLEQELAGRQSGKQNWLEPLNAVISLSSLAVFWFHNGSIAQKRMILTTLGSNFSLTDKKVSIQAMELLQQLPNSCDIPGMLALIEYVRMKLADREGREKLEKLVELEGSLIEILGTPELKEAA